MWKVDKSPPFLFTLGRSQKLNAERGKKGEFWTLPKEIELMNTTLDNAISYLKNIYAL